MSYRTQEILRMIIPGLYLIAMMLILFLVGNGWNKIPTKEQNTIIDVLKGASNVVVLLLPFLGFVAGYVIECLMSFFERLLYKCGLKRPSKVVLEGCKMYFLNNLKDIKKELNVRDVFNNKQAGEAFQKAKQTIQRQEVETFHDSSIMARNILGSQIILVIYTAIYVGPLSKKLGIMLVLLVILSLYWYHKNCIYVKYVLSEYYKTINKKNKLN